MKEITLYQEENGDWVAISDKIPGFAAKGGNPQEALEKMKQAMRMYFPCGDCKGSDQVR